MFPKKEKTIPAAILALLSVMDADRAAVVALCPAQDGATETDVGNARTIAERACALLPKAPKATEAEKLLAKAIAKCNSMALALGDLAAMRAPQPASIFGYKLMTGSKTAKVDLVVEALGELATARGDGLASELESSTCGIGKSGGFVKSGTKGAKPAAKAWRALTGAAAQSGLLTPKAVREFGEKLANLAVAA